MYKIAFLFHFRLLAEVTQKPLIAKMHYITNNIILNKNLISM